MDVLEGLERSVRELAGKVGASVVGIGGWRAGSGVVIEHGKVLTNAHNVRDGQVSVRFVGGRTAEGAVAGIDPDADLAVVSVDTGGIDAVEWSSERLDVGIGSPVFAAANPAGRGLRVTFGLVSATDRAFRGPRGRRIAGGIEHTAALARGSSGSGLFDAAGRLIGLNTHRLAEGFYLAIPADADFRARVGALGRGESPARPRLGIGLARAHTARRLRTAVGLPERDGLLISVVEDDSPASRAGLERGDLIVEAGGRPIGDIDDLYEALDSVHGEGGFLVTIVRGTEERTVNLGSGPAVGDA